MLRLERNGPVAVLTLDHPPSRNALSSEMMAALAARLDGIAGDSSLRAVVVRADGPAFSAGHDLKEIQACRNDPDGGVAAFDDLFARCEALMARIRSLPQPVVAAVQGVAVAAGCQFVATCDLALASTTARFGVNGIAAGFFCSTPGVALARNVGRKAAMELLLSGRLIDAAEAREAGLVNRVVAPEVLDAEAAGLAASIAARPGPVLALGKRVFHAQADADTAAAYRIASPAMVENLLLDDCDEGIRAFLEKRPPDWNRDLNS